MLEIIRGTAVVLLLGLPAAADAQRREAAGIVTRAPNGVVGSRAFGAPIPHDVADSRSLPGRSTLAERWVSGLVTGTIVVLPLVLIDRQNSDVLDRWAAPVYVAGSTTGVVLATKAREGAHPLLVLAGTTVGAVLLIANARDSGGDGGPDLRDLTVWFGIPLAGALAHSVGER
jgi:hypothetical protein